jgi:hypothetical protein
MFLWLTLPETMDSVRAAERRAGRRRRLRSGAAFYPGDRKFNTLRLNFTACEPDTIAKASRAWPGSSRDNIAAYRFFFAAVFLRAGFFAGLRDFAAAFFFAGFPARADVVRALVAGLRLVPALRRALGAGAAEAMSMIASPDTGSVTPRSAPNSSRQCRKVSSSPIIRGRAPDDVVEGFPFPDGAVSAVTGLHQRKAPCAAETVKSETSMCGYEFLLVIRFDAKAHHVESAHCCPL